MTLRERMEKVAKDLMRMERDSWGRNGDEDKAYGRAAQEVYKAAAIISAKGLGMPVTCDGRSCGMWALCQGTKIYNPVPVKMIKDSPVGL